MTQLDYSAFLKAIEPYSNIALTAPAGADGDSVGTQSALRELLLQKYPEKKVRIVNEEPCPKRYLFLPQAKYFEVSKDILKGPRENWPDVLICVDGGASRIGDETTQLWDAAKSRGQVDHHAIGVQSKYDFRLYNPQAAATTEILFGMIQSLKFQLTPSIAQAIYLGLIFDTGLFKHSNTRPETLEIGAKLLETGFDHTSTAEKGMLIKSPGAFKIMKYILNSAHFDFDGRYVWSALRYKEFQDAGGDSDDREGIIDNLFLVQGCEIAAFYFEKNPNEWKVSFRSRGHDVASLAQTLNPSGGGHKQAAGCSLDGAEMSVLEVCHKAVKKTLDAKS